MEELVFITKKKNRAETDVSLNVTHSQDGKNNTVSIVFRHGVEKLITMGKSEYVVVAQLGERVYFKYANEAEGYKLSDRKNKAHNYYTSISENVAPSFYKFIEKHTGDYALKFDTDRNLHYVDCE